MYYIQFKYKNQLETIDEFESRKEALAMLEEYRFGSHEGYYYLSTRSCKDWRN